MPAFASTSRIAAATWAPNNLPRTVRTCAEAVERLDELLAKLGMPCDVANITREHVQAFIGHLLAKAKRATAANRHRFLQALFKVTWRRTAR